jgi:chromosome partitioning protein
MALVISCVAQKGGVGKSTLSRLIAREYAANDWSVKIADMDLQQGTSYRWHQRRLMSGTEPTLSVEQFRDVDKALKSTTAADLLVFDGAPAADRQTREIAAQSDLIVIPSSLSLDDLEPTVRLANELQQHCDAQRLCFCLCRVGTSTPELNEAIDYLKATPYHLLDGHLQEKTGYRRASDAGRTATETAFFGLNEKADRLAQSIIDRVNQLGLDQTTYAEAANG